MPVIARFYGIVIKAVKVDVGGYGVWWNDDMDVSEQELWHNGELLTQQRMPA